MGIRYVVKPRPSGKASVMRFDGKGSVRLVAVYENQDVAEKIAESLNLHRNAEDN